MRPMLLCVSHCLSINPGSKLVIFRHLKGQEQPSSLQFVGNYLYNVRLVKYLNFILKTNFNT